MPTPTGAKIITDTQLVWLNQHVGLANILPETVKITHAYVRHANLVGTKPRQDIAELRASNIRIVPKTTTSRILPPKRLEQHAIGVLQANFTVEAIAIKLQHVNRHIHADVPMATLSITCQPHTQKVPATQTTKIDAEHVREGIG
eukprot:COSAG01_NODE_910_length_12784_cov_15.136460_5_plen_145_part_00